MIPDYQSVMLPLLAALSDRREHAFGDIVERLAKDFQLTEDEKKELLPSETTFVFSNRVGWARTYLKKAGLIKVPRRGVVAITQRGQDVLNKKPRRIDVFHRKRKRNSRFHFTDHTYQINR